MGPQGWIESARMWAGEGEQRRREHPLLCMGGWEVGGIMLEVPGGRSGGDLKDPEGYCALGPGLWPLLPAPT